MLENNELNTRQWGLYNYLKEQKGQPVFQRKICLDLKDKFEEYNFKADANFHESKARIILTSDIRHINNSDVIQKVIVSSSKGIYISKKEGYAETLQREWNAILRRIKRFNKKRQKILLDNQCKLILGKGNEREVIEAFIK